MSDKKTWINVLPMNQLTTLFDETGEPEEVFMLDSYEINNGVPKCLIKTTQGAMTQVGLRETKIGRNLSVRFHVPIELHNVPGIGLSPKMVYLLPKGYMIQEYRAASYVPPEEKLYDAARRHTISLVKG